MANRERAKNMAARGASAQEIRQTTGVTAQAARNIVSRAAPTPAPVYTNAGPSPMPSAAQPSAPAAPMQIRQPNNDLIVTQAPARPANVQPSYVDAGSGQSFPTRFIPGAMQPGQVGYDPNTGGGVWSAGKMSDEEIRAFYRSSDPINGGGDSFISMSGKPASAFTLEGLYGSAMPSSAAAAPTPTASTAANKKPSTISQGLRSMGEGGISKSELDSIMKGTKQSGGDIIQRLDRINANLASKDKTGISLNSGAANMLIRRSRKEAPRLIGQGSLFGTGKIGSALQEMMGTRESGGYINPQSGAQSRTPAVEPKFMMGGTAIRPGGRETVRGFGKQYTRGAGSTSPMPSLPDTSPVPSTEPISGGSMGGGDVSTAIEEAPMTPEQMTDASTAGFDSAGLANWATGFKRARSGRSRAGRSAQGLASQRVAPRTNVLGF